MPSSSELFILQVVCHQDDCLNMLSHNFVTVSLCTDRMLIMTPDPSKGAH